MLRAVRTQRRFIVAGLLMGLAVAVFLNWSAERKYSSTTQFFVSTAASAEARDPYGDQQFSQQRAISYVQLLTGRELARAVVDELALPLTPEQLTEMVTATPLPDTVVLEVTVTDTSPERAQAIATSVGNQFISRVRQVETPEGTATPTIEIRIIEPPSFEPTPVSPATERTIALGTALGLLLGLGVALVRARMDRSIRSEEAAAADGLELLGRVSVDRQLTRRHVSSGAEQSAVAEAFRTIRVNLQHLGRDHPPRVVVVAGALPGEGASTVAVNLAVSLARAGNKVMLIDADLRRPRAARQLGLGSDSGLTDVLTGDADLDQAARRWGASTLTVLDAGPLPADPAEALGSEAMRSLLKTLRDQHDYVIVDAPPAAARDRRSRPQRPRRRLPRRRQVRPDHAGPTGRGHGDRDAGARRRPRAGAQPRAGHRHHHSRPAEGLRRRLRSSANAPSARPYEPAAGPGRRPRSRRTTDHRITSHPGPPDEPARGDRAVIDAGAQPRSCTPRSLEPAPARADVAPTHASEG